jgi:sugar-specific transcriptional regulator TrmB
LKDFGLTEKEVEIYLLLAKNQALKGGEIAKSLRMHKAQVYRSLKSLQDKSIVESTLESPIRFTALSFENVLDFFAKVKREEAALIDGTKQELIKSWNKISKLKPELPLEKFTVIKGNQKINSKTLLMIKETKTNLSIITTIPELVHAEQMGLFDAAIYHPLKSEIQFRVLTKIFEENLKAFEVLFRKATNANAIFSGRTPELNSRLPPRMIIRDNEEIIFYITPKANQPATNKDEICLWTNCKVLVQAFNSNFEDAWGKATDILKKIAEKKIDKTTRTYLIDDDKAKEKYGKTIQSAKEEILIITSTRGLLESYEKMPFLSERAKMGVSVKIMAPIVSENLNAAQQLAKFCLVKHVPIGYLGTTIVDGIHLFQFNDDYPRTEDYETKQYFKETFYSNKSEYIEKTKIIFNDIWENSIAPSPITLKNIVRPTEPTVVKRTSQETLKKIRVNLQLSTDEEEIKNQTEKDVINKIIKAQAFPDKNLSNDIVVHYGTAGQAIIHPPTFLNLPDLLLIFSHNDKHSTNGEQDFLIVLSWEETPKGKGFKPSVFIYDNLKARSYWEKLWGDTFFIKPLMLVRKNELQIQLHGNTFFAGWTIPIQLNSSCILPPGCVSLEGYGNVKPDTESLRYPSGYRNVHVYNGMEAFVTFMHPSSKYSGPGTDGVLARESIVTVYPPEK